MCRRVLLPGGHLVSPDSIDRLFVLGYLLRPTNRGLCGVIADMVS